MVQDIVQDNVEPIKCSKIKKFKKVWFKMFKIVLY